MHHTKMLPFLKELNLPEFQGRTDEEILALATTGELPSSKPVRTPEEIFSAAKTILKANVSQTKAFLENSTFVSGGHVWQCDRESRVRLYGLGSLREAEFPADRTWRTAANVDVEVTYAYVQGLLADLEAYTNSLFLASQAHKQAIEALTTQEELNAYDVLSGWPANTL